MFGTSGIRGVYGQDVTPALAFRIAAIFCGKKLVVGRDIRESGPTLLDAVCRGANASGADVVDLGVVPTPTVALATKKHACRGIMLTASHNPPEYNGLKLIERGKEIGKALEKEVTRRYESGEAMDGTRAGGRNGSVDDERARVHDNEIIRDHMELVMRMVDARAIAAKKPKVVVDCNGAASAITPYLLTGLGCRVVSVNASMDCFNRPSEPSGRNLAYLSGFIRETGADFAIAHDGDGDRCMVMDERGEALPLDSQLAIMIEHELEGAGKGSRKIVSTVESSLAIRDVVEKAGGKITITPVGSTYVGDALEDVGALFGGEPCGEYIYRDGVHVPDAVLAAAKFAEIFCQKGAFSKLKTRYPQNPMVREKYGTKDKRRAMEGIISQVRSLGINGTIRADDGIRLDEDDGWFLIRASGTEPIVRLTMEYKAEGKLRRREDELVGIIRSNCAPG
jgi:phosphoglucosamine mutase